PYTDSSLNLIRKRNHLSESEANNESIGINNPSVSPPAAAAVAITTTTTASSTNKSNLARTAILLAAKRAACNNNTNNYDASTFTLVDCTEDEADSNAGVFRQRFDAIDLTDE
ncbi:unnamed protein product, partial [Rotaria magnacalcarata]